MMGNLTFGVGVEGIIMRQILDNYQSPWASEMKYLHHLQQVSSTTKQAKALNAIAIEKNIGLMLVIHGSIHIYHVLQILPL